MLKKNKIESWDERRDYIVLDDSKTAIAFATDHWVHSCERSILQKGRFAVALSGGSTPKAIYQALSERKEIEWQKVHLFWSDERSVGENHPMSNFHMAMEAGLGKVPIPKHQIHRMKAEHDIELMALEYEETIQRLLGKHLFDLVMLGVGEDGHTASLFPNSKALQEQKRIVVPNFAGEKLGMRMSFTFPCINQSSHIAIYAIGSSKKEILPKVLNAPIDSPWPASRIGTVSSKALWVMDSDSSQNLKK